MGAARRSREDGDAARAAATALLACGVLPARLAMLIAVVSPALFARCVWSLAAIAVVTTLGGFLTLRRAGSGVPPASAQPRNPTQLRSALAFAAIFVVISVVTRATIEFGGNDAFLVAAAAAGITDMDAIAMSTAREVADGAVAPSLGTLAVLIALLVNTVFKLAMTRVLGTKAMFGLALPTLGFAALIAVVGAWLA